MTSPVTDPWPPTMRGPPSPTCAARSPRPSSGRTRGHRSGDRAALHRGHVLLEGVPGVAKTLLVRTWPWPSTSRPSGCSSPRPDAGGHRLAGLRRAHSRVLVRTGRSSPTCCWPTRSTEPRRRHGPPCWRRWRSSRSRWRARPGHCRTRSSSPPRRTRSSTRAPTRCRRPSRPIRAQADPSPFPIATTRSPCFDAMRTASTRVTSRRRASSGWPGRPISPPAGPRWGGSGADLTCWAMSSTWSRPRSSPSLQLGVSPRGATALLATSRAWAWLSGRDYVTPTTSRLARPSLRHRVTLRPEAELEGVTADAVLDTVLATVPVPR